MSAARPRASHLLGHLVASREALTTLLAAVAALVLLVAAAGTARAQQAAGIDSYDRDMLTALIETVIAADQGELIMTSAIPAQEPRAVDRSAAGSPMDISPVARPDVHDAASDAVSAMPDTPRAPGFALQLGSFTSAANAQRGFEAANARYAGTIEARTLYVQPVDLGERGVYHRLRIGGYEDVAQALAGCGTLDISISDCMVVAAGQ